MANEKMKNHNSPQVAQPLTRSELQLMQHLWSLPAAGGFVADVLACYEEPQPAYNTVATFLKILSEKGYLRAVKTGHMNYYSARITRREYIHMAVTRLCDDFFEGNATELARFIESDLAAERTKE